MMSIIKSTTNSMLSPLQRKRKQRYILILAEALWLILFLIVRGHLHSLGAIAIPAVISAIICWWTNKKLNCPKLSPPDDFLFSSFLPFCGGLVLEILITVVVVLKLTDDTIQSVGAAMTLCQACLFVLSLALIWVHSRPDQLQYILYAIAYFFIVILEWANTAGLNPLSLLNIDLEFSIPFFILPLKEAMLLYIILDVALQAIANKRNAGEKRHEE